MSTGGLVRIQNRIAVAEYGDPTGMPVIFCHGWPSSCTMAALTDVAAREVGVRILSPDRPGISQSVFQQDRKLLDWPSMLQTIMEHFGLNQVRLLAISGGAPYAYAAGYCMPEKVRAMAVVSGVPPIFELQNHEGLMPLHRWMLALYRSNPSLLRFFFRLARPFASMRMSLRVARSYARFCLQPCDAESLRDSAAFNACFESQRRAWRGSAEGVMTDAQIYAEPWGFSLEQVPVPVRLWHGKRDRTFSVRGAQEVAQRLPDCVARYVDDAGHFSLPIRHAREILEDLVSV